MSKKIHIPVIEICPSSVWGSEPIEWEGNKFKTPLLHFSSDLSQLYDKYYKAVMEQYKVRDNLSICQKKKKIVAVWNFNMGVNGGILKCAISWKQLIVAWNGRKFGTLPVNYCMCRELFHVCFFEFSLGIFSALCKISDVKIFKAYCSPRFHSISTKLHCKYVDHEGI